MSENKLYNKKTYEDNKKLLVSLFTNKERYYYDDIHQYFKLVSVKSIENMIEIIDTKSKISLRILDWFVTKYSNENKTTYRIDNKTDDIGFTVHIGYKSQLKTYKKRYFDPFRRYKKFFYYYKINTNQYKRFETTLGQLNFFKWAFKKKVIEYVELHFIMLVASMNQSNKEDKERKKQKKITTHITESSNTSMISDYSSTSSDDKKLLNNNMKIILSFD
jgi:hypothetical protein